MKLFFFCIFIMLLTLALALSWPKSEKVFIYKTLKIEKMASSGLAPVKKKTSIKGLEDIPSEYLEQIIDVFSPEIRQSK